MKWLKMTNPSDWFMWIYVEFVILCKKTIHSGFSYLRLIDDDGDMTIKRKFIMLMEFYTHIFHINRLFIEKDVLLQLLSL